MSGKNLMWIERWIETDLANFLSIPEYFHSFIISRALPQLQVSKEKALSLIFILPGQTWKDNFANLKLNLTLQ